MALKDWDGVPYTSVDCCRDHTEWNNMIEYIKHAGSCANAGGFVLYDDDASTTIWFEFYENSIDFLEDRAIYINADETYVGHGAGDGITTGINNTLFGNNAGNALTDGLGNVLLGMNTGSINPSIDRCVFVGTGAGQNNTQDNIVGIGYEALDSCTGLENTAVGYQTLDAACSGINNTAVGYTVLSTNIGGSHNTGVGHNVLFANTSGNSNTAMGKDALSANIDGTYNTMFGAYCGDVVTTGDYNAGFGGAALGTLTTGSSNTAVGVSAGENIGVAVDSCVLLGRSAGGNCAASNRLYINTTNSAFPLIYGEFDNDIVKFGDNSAEFFTQFSFNGTLTEMTGSQTSTDNFKIRANSANAHPYIELSGNATVILDCATGSSINLSENGGVFGYIMEDGTMKIASMANRDIRFIPNGTGLVRFGTYAAKGAEAFDGFITMRDEVGNSRKLMICA